MAGQIHGVMHDWIGATLVAFCLLLGIISPVLSFFAYAMLMLAVLAFSEERSAKVLRTPLAPPKKKDKGSGE